MNVSCCLQGNTVGVEGNHGSGSAAKVAGEPKAGAIGPRWVHVSESLPLPAAAESYRTGQSDWEARSFGPKLNSVVVRIESCSLPAKAWGFRRRGAFVGWRL